MNITATSCGHAQRFVCRTSLTILPFRGSAVSSFCLSAGERRLVHRSPRRLRSICASESLLLFRNIDTSYTFIFDRLVVPFSALVRSPPRVILFLFAIRDFCIAKVGETISTDEKIYFGNAADATWLGAARSDVPARCRGYKYPTHGVLFPNGLEPIRIRERGHETRVEKEGSRKSVGDDSTRFVDDERFAALRLANLWNN